MYDLLLLVFSLIPLVPLAFFWCCCECEVFADAFPGSTYGSAWNVRSGTWTVVSGRLRTSSTNAMIICDTAAGTSGVATVSGAAFPGSGSSYRLIGAYLDDNNYVYLEVELTVFGYAYLYKVEAGTPTLLDSLINEGALDTSTLSLCWTGFSVSAQAGGAVRTLHGTAITTGTKAGVGSGSIASSVSFDDFSVGKHLLQQSNCDECPECNDACADGLPDTIEVTFPGGWSNSASTTGATTPGLNDDLRCDDNCPDLNGATYILSPMTAEPYSGTGSPMCGYSVPYQEFGGGYYPIDFNCQYVYEDDEFCDLLITAPSPQFFLPAYLTIVAYFVRTGSTYRLHLIVHIGEPQTGSAYYSWRWRSAEISVFDTCAAKEWEMEFVSEGGCGSGYPDPNGICTLDPSEIPTVVAA